MATNFDCSLNGLPCTSFLAQFHFHDKGARNFCCLCRLFKLHTRYYLTSDNVWFWGGLHLKNVGHKIRHSRIALVSALLLEQYFPHNFKCLWLIFLRMVTSVGITTLVFDTIVSVYYEHIWNWLLRPRCTQNTNLIFMYINSHWLFFNRIWMIHLAEWVILVF